MNEHAPNTKEQRIREKIEAVRGRKDLLGEEMDSEILEAVAMVNLFGLPTNGSCEGHLNHGLANPWIAVTALDKPKYAHVGEQEKKEEIAAKYGIKADDVDRYIHDEACEEYYAWLRENDVPCTTEFGKWRAKEDSIIELAVEMVRTFNLDRNDKEMLRMRHRRISAGDDEKAPVDTDTDGLAERLKARQEVMKSFANYLRARYITQTP